MRYFIISIYTILVALLFLVGCSTPSTTPAPTPASSTFGEYCSAASATGVNIPNAPIYTPQVYLNGLRQSSSDYSVNGLMITLNVPLAAGSDLICVDYFHQ